MTAAPEKSKTTLADLRNVGLICPVCLSADDPRNSKFEVSSPIFHKSGVFFVNQFV